MVGHLSPCHVHVSCPGRPRRAIGRRTSSTLPRERQRKSTSAEARIATFSAHRRMVSVLMVRPLAVTVPGEKCAIPEQGDQTKIAFPESCHRWGNLKNNPDKGGKLNQSMHANMYDHSHEHKWKLVYMYIDYTC